VALELQRSGSPEHHVLVWFSFPLKHLKILEMHALRKILPKRVHQHEAFFLKICKNHALRKIILLGEIQG
jgi:hypothetical protein